MYRGAMRCILSELVRQDRLVVVQDLTVAEPKTKLLLAKLKELSAESALIVAAEVSENLFLSARNLPKVGDLVIALDRPGAPTFEITVVESDGVARVLLSLVKVPS